MTRARDLANIADGTFTATDLDLSGTLTVSGDANFDSGSLFVDVSENKVGVGTTLPSRLLDVYSNSAQSDLAITASTTGQSFLAFADTADSNVGAIAYDHATDHMRFRVNDAERMRIDSSGNLLVGKTSAAYNTDGFEARPNGETYVSRSGTPMAINRNSSDGTLLNFYKDGSTVGSIANNGANIAIGSSNTGLYFWEGGNSIYPVTPSTGASQDGTKDLGRSSARFKDLYLSGGVYLGGTGAANLLDDYEEGTWTATWTTYSTPPTTPPTAAGFYTKVGNLVTAGVRIGPGNLSGATGAMKISGLPFTVSNSTTSNPQGSVSLYGIAFAANTVQCIPWATGNTTDVALYLTIDNGAWAYAAVTAGPGKYMELTITYRSS